MKIAVASGKGGTGKTTVAVNLAYFNNLDLFDLDVEEPNDHLFIKGRKTEVLAYRKVPLVKDNCNGCGVCKDVCQYSAIFVIDKAYPLPELCHSCGACSYFCPENAIEEIDREIYIKYFKPRSKILKERVEKPITELRSKKAGHYFISIPGTIAIFGSKNVEYWQFAGEEGIEFLKYIMEKGDEVINEIIGVVSNEG